VDPWLRFPRKYLLSPVLGEVALNIVLHSFSPSPQRGEGWGEGRERSERTLVVVVAVSKRRARSLRSRPLTRRAARVGLSPPGRGNKRVARWNRLPIY